ncbi:Uncharacterized protein Adt_27574 [Abeliophyllum distichum]|uniref:Uncharacterized protein n=1 Tax=Abeliophyllum distichum TaxID=126358 RepID=A0ABD1RU50_9LAMI
MVVEDEMIEDPIEEEVKLEENQENEEEEEVMQIFVNALVGNMRHRTIRIPDKLKGKRVSILIDSGSTHNFMDEKLVQSLKCEIDFSKVTLVSMANGQKLESKALCKLLGSISFKNGDEVVELTCKEPGGRLEWIEGRKMNKWLIQQEYDPTGLPPPRSHDHHILLKEGAQPFIMRPYKCPFIQKIEVEKMQLNKLTVKDKYPMPLIDEFIDELYGAKYYSKIDMRSSYHHIRVRPGDIYKTAFKTHQGCMSLSKSLENHYELLRLVLKLLRKHQLYAKHTKCSFRQTQIEYLGHIIFRAGVSAYPKKIEAIQDWASPINLKQLRDCLGLTGYYRKVVKGYSTMASPLTELLKKDMFIWNEAA